jgi:hypothetical protein
MDNVEKVVECLKRIKLNLENCKDGEYSYDRAFNNILEIADVAIEYCSPKPQTEESFHGTLKKKSYEELLKGYQEKFRRVKDLEADLKVAVEALEPIAEEYKYLIKRQCCPSSLKLYERAKQAIESIRRKGK